MEDILQVRIKPLPQRANPNQPSSQSLTLSKSSKAEGYKAFRDEVVNALKSYPELVGDERLGKAITRVSKVGGS